jgi:NitT/TauT family transport system ATP-binding protein/nitrate/nitrite transport system substrate-binding protein
MPKVRIGVVRLTDAAPAFVAEAHGFFAAEGVHPEISIEPSWANIADKLTYRALDAAIILPPLAFAVALGLRGALASLVVPMAISQNGNTVTVSPALARAIGSGAADPAAVGRRLARVAAAPGARRLRLAVVHAYSSHDLLLRHWLAAAEIDPTRDVEIVVVPPVDMVAALEQGEIDGFCAGAPWGAVATERDSGYSVVPSSAIWPNHPEKCLAVTADWAECHPDGLKALLRALVRAARFCDDPANADAIARLLARPDRLGVPASAIRASLPGAPRGSGADISCFFTGDAVWPLPSHAGWFLGQMARWGQFGSTVDRTAVARAVYRPDLLAAAAPELAVPQELSA